MLPTTLSPIIITVLISPYNLGDVVSKFLNSKLCPHVCHFFIVLIKEYISFYFLYFLLNSIGPPQISCFIHAYIQQILHSSYNFPGSILDDKDSVTNMPKTLSCGFNSS